MNVPQILQSFSVVLVIAATFAIGHAIARFERQEAVLPAASEQKMQFDERVGAEQQDLPAPPKSRRVSAMSRGSERVMYRYESHATEPELAQFYRTEMPRHGWRELKPPGGDAGGGYAGTLMQFTNKTGNVAVVAVSRDSGDEVGVTVMRLAGARRE